MRDLILIAHNLRSAHNVGSLLRTADGLGVSVWLTGYTPYPLTSDDGRLPHLVRKIDRQIAKTALGAEKSVSWQQAAAIEPVIADLKSRGYQVVALEQASDAISLPDFSAPRHVALVVGREVEGLEPAVLKACDQVVEIPMLGGKESYNVVQAAAMALYQLRYLT